MTRYSFWIFVSQSNFYVKVFLGGKTNKLARGEVSSYFSIDHLGFEGSQPIQYNTIHSLIISREVLILTLSILPAMQGCISWYIPWYGLMMREWPYTASSRDILGCTSPPTSRFPSALEMSLGLRPRDISRASGNLSVVGDVQPNTSLLSAVYGYNMQNILHDDIYHC